MSEPLAPWDRGARILGVPQLISCYNHQKNCFLSSGIFGHKNLLILPRVQQHSEMPIVSLQRRWAVVERDRSKTRNTKNSHNYKNAATVRFIIAALMPHSRAESTPEVCLEVLISVKYFWVCSQIYIWFPILLCFQYSNKSINHKMMICFSRRDYRAAPLAGGWGAY